MTFFRWHIRKNTDTAKRAVVKRVAASALHQYQKTFQDLARYDRGERLSLPR